MQCTKVVSRRGCQDGDGTKCRNRYPTNFRRVTNTAIGLESLGPVGTARISLQDSIVFSICLFWFSSQSLCRTCSTRRSSVLNTSVNSASTSSSFPSDTCVVCWREKHVIWATGQDTECDKDSLNLHATPAGLICGNHRFNKFLFLSCPQQLQAECMIWQSKARGTLLVSCSSPSLSWKLRALRSGVTKIAHWSDWRVDRILSLSVNSTDRIVIVFSSPSFSSSSPSPVSFSLSVFHHYLHRVTKLKRFHYRTFL